MIKDWGDVKGLSAAPWSLSQEELVKGTHHGMQHMPELGEMAGDGF